MAGGGGFVLGEERGELLQWPSQITKLPRNQTVSCEALPGKAVGGAACVGALVLRAAGRTGVSSTHARV
jgi:hypothetical protein